MIKFYAPGLFSRVFVAFEDREERNGTRVRKALKAFEALKASAMVAVFVILAACVAMPGEAFAFSVNYTGDQAGEGGLAGVIGSDPGALSEVKAKAAKAANFIDSFQRYAAATYKKKALDAGELKSRGRVNVNGGFRFDARGDVVNFTTRNMAANQYEQITADCVRVGKNCYIYQARGVSVSEYYLDRLVTEFDGCIYPNNTANFGFEWKPGVDGDEHITLLLMDIKDGMEHTSAYVAGYFFAGDEYPKAQVPHSNEREMIYLDVVQGGFNDDENFRRFCRTIAHEFQHAIHWHHDASEMTWLNEMMSEYAALVNNYGHPGQINAYFKAPDTSLIAWRADRGIQNYGAIYMFGYYLIRTVVAVYAKNDPAAAGRFTRALVASPEHGIASVLATLKLFGVNRNFKDIYLDWLTANAVNNQAVSKRFGYDANLAGAIKFKYNVHGALPVASQAGALDAYGGLYAVFSVDPEFLKKANGGVEVPLSGLQSGGYAFKIAAERTDDQGGNQLIGRLIKIKIDGTYSGDDFIIGPDNNYIFTVPGFPAEYKTLIFVFGIVASEQLTVSRPTYRYSYAFVPIASSARYMVSAYRRLGADQGLSAASRAAAYETLSNDILSSLSTAEGAAEFEGLAKTLPAGERADLVKMLGEVKNKPAFRRLQDENTRGARPASEIIDALIESAGKY